MVTAADAVVHPILILQYQNLYSRLESGNVVFIASVPLRSYRTQLQTRFTCAKWGPPISLAEILSWMAFLSEALNSHNVGKCPTGF